MALIDPSNTVKGVAERLARLASRPERAFISCEFESETARRNVVDNLRAALSLDGGERFSEYTLPTGCAPSALVSGLIRALSDNGPGIVSVSGFETASGSGRELEEKIQALNFARDSLAVAGVRQIWWMNGSFVVSLIRGAPDLDSWFCARLRLLEHIVAPSPVVATSIVSGESFGAALNVEAEAKKRASALIDEFERGILRKRPPQELEKIVSEIFDTLVAAGLYKEAQTLRDRLNKRLDSAESVDFFISYAHADEKMAEWIAWVLEEAGYSTIIQAWDFRAGVQFPVMMQQAATRAKRIVACLSQSYMDSRYTQPEWSAFFVKDVSEIASRIIPVLIEDFDPPGMFASLTYIDLVGLDEKAAQEKLLKEVNLVVSGNRGKSDRRPLFTPVKKTRLSTNRPVFNMVKPALQPNRWKVGPDELVGRGDDLEWLRERLCNQDRADAPIFSLCATGGMGKTFLAHTFLQQNVDPENLWPIYLGETAPFAAGVQFLQRQGVETSMIDPNERPVKELEDFYRNGSGTLFIDDLCSEDAELLFPRVQGWKVLFTTRDRALARKLCGDRNVKELNALSIDESMELIRKVLADCFMDEKLHDYENLCGFLVNRPYSVRLAAGYLAGAIDPDPVHLEERLRNNTTGVKLDEEYSFDWIPALLRECCSQLQAKCAGAMQLVRSLSLCADEGIALKRLLEWQSFSMDGESGGAVDTFEKYAQVAKDMGLVLAGNGKSGGKGGGETVLRLHTDLLRLLRKEWDVALMQPQLFSFMEYLHKTLVERPQGAPPDISLHPQIFSLVDRFKEDGAICMRLYDLFWIHLYNTGELQACFELGEHLIKHVQESKDKNSLQKVWGNQALILSYWGRLDEAMGLHRKEEAICEELGNRDSLQRSYGNQALILKAWGRLDEAMELHRKEEAICEELGNKDGLQASYGNQALILQAWDRLDEAMELHRKEEKLCEELGDKDGLQKSYGNQALILQAWDRLDEAMELHRKKEKLCEELGNRDGLQISYCNQAAILHGRGRLDEAMTLYKKQEAICREVGLIPSLKICLNNQIVLLEQANRSDEAAEIRTELAQLEASGAA